MKLLSWNVNGLRSVMAKGFLSVAQSGEYDVLMLQEIKADTVPREILGLNYFCYMNNAKKKGYSGTLTLTKVKPLSASNGMGDSVFDAEGRVNLLEFEDLYVLNTYFPNSQHGLARLDFKLKFNDEFERFANKLDEKKPLVIGGDFNVAHQEIDIARPKDNANNAGFTLEEREWMTRFLDENYVDTYRMFVREGGHYTWWTYRFDARKRNIGWRIDYFVVSRRLAHKIRRADILSGIGGSDHAPICLEIA